MTKAAKEAKEHTSWIAPDEAYDAALVGFAGYRTSTRERRSGI
jgi:maltooligosyltrehalose synthase